MELFPAGERSLHIESALQPLVFPMAHHGRDQEVSGENRFLHRLLGSSVSTRDRPAGVGEIHRNIVCDGCQMVSWKLQVTV